MTVLSIQRLFLPSNVGFGQTYLIHCSLPCPHSPSLDLSATCPDQWSMCGSSRPYSEECRWRRHWRTFHGHCCNCQKFLTQTVSWRLHSNQWHQPGWDRVPGSASAERVGIFYGSSGLSRSRRCS